MSAAASPLSRRSVVPAWLTWFLITSFVGAMAALFWIPVPTANRDIIVYMVGQLSGFTGAAIAFWIGTTRQSEAKTELIAKAQPIQQ